MKTEEIIGKTFGRLTVSHEILERSKRGEIQIFCSCVCGSFVILPRTRVIGGGARSCGCLQKERASQNGISSAKYLRVRKDVIEPITPNLAYFLGFFSADGSLKGNTATISIQRRDEFLLKEFVQLLEINNPVTRRDASYSYKGEKKIARCSSLLIYDKPFADFLRGNGIYPNKSFSIKFPSMLPATAIRHFVRGYWDGNGTINISKKTGVRDINVAVCSASVSFICDLRSWLDEHHVSCGAFYCFGNVHTFRVSTKGDNLYKFYKLLYEDESMCLDRKRSALEEILDYIRNSKKSKHSRKIGELL